MAVTKGLVNIGDARITESLSVGTGNAIGQYSVAEGMITEASGDGSHAEGENTKAIGRASHAEGQNFSKSSGVTITGVTYQFQGVSIFRTSSAQSLSVNDIIQVIDATDNSLMVTSKVTAVTSSYFMTNNDVYPLLTSGTNYTIKTSNVDSHGIASHTEGCHTYAYGNYSHAEGYLTSATNEGSHAEGSNSVAKGSASHAEGSGTLAKGHHSHSEGSGTLAEGSASHAEGCGTKATAEYSHAEGSGTTASGPSSHAEGSGTTAIGDASHAEGSYTEANGYASHAEGFASKASGYTSHAEGRSTTASGSSSHAEGSGTTASNDYSHAEGYNSKTGGSETANTLESGISVDNGVYAHAEGNATQAKGTSSHSEGVKTFASGTGSHAEGYSINKTEDALDISASGNGSHAEGYAEVDDLSSKYKKRYDDLKNNPIYSILSNNNGSHAGGYVYHITDESGGGKSGYAIFNGYVSSWNTFSLANYYPYNAAFGEASFVHGNDVKGFNFSDSIFGWGNRSINYSQPEVFDTVFNIKTGDTTTLVGTCQYMDDIDDKNRLPIGPITVCGMFNSTCVDGNPLDYKYYYFGSYKGTRGQINLREYQPAFMVGNGFSPDPLERCNAFVVDYHGNIWVGNDIKTLGSIHCDGNVYGQEFVPSDERLKNIHSEIELNDCYKLINNSRYVKFDYKKDTDKKEHIGLIAQDVQKVFPQLVEEYDEGNLGLNYDSLVAVCMKTIKDLNERVTKLEEEINELKKNK